MGLASELKQVTEGLRWRAKASDKKAVKAFLAKKAATGERVVSTGQTLTLKKRLDWGTPDPRHPQTGQRLPDGYPVAAWIGGELTFTRYGSRSDAAQVQSLITNALPVTTKFRYEDVEVLDELKLVTERVSAADLRRRVLQVLKMHAGPVEVTDLARHRSFRGVHFARLQKTVDDYVKKGLVSMTGTKVSMKEDVLDERMKGGEAFSKASGLWNKHKQGILTLTTSLRVAVEAIKRTPGYETGRGKNRPGAAELDAGVRHLTEAVRMLRVGFEKMGVTTFLEDWDEDGDGLGMDDEFKRKKPTDAKDIEKEVEKKKAAAAAQAPAQGQPEPPPPEEEPEEEPPPEEVKGMYDEERNLLGRLNQMVESL